MRDYLLAIAALLLLSVLAAPPAQAVGTPAGTTISNQAYADYKDANGNSMTRVYSNSVTVTVTQVASINVSPDAAAHNGIAGTDVSYPVSICNIGNGSDTMNLTASSSLGSVVIYRDDNGDGIWQSATETTVVSTTGALAADACFKAIAVVTIPAATPNLTTITTTITGTSVFSGTVTDASTFTTTVQAAKITLVKTASVSSAKPGDIITYSISAINSGGSTSYSLLATDKIPDNTTYVAGSMRVGPVGGTYDTAHVMTDANDVEDWTSTEGANTAKSNAYFDSANNQVVLNKTQNPPSGLFYFQVRVNNNVASGTAISNTLTLKYGLLDNGLRPYTETSNTATVSVSDSPSVLLSSSQSASADVGSQVIYAFTAKNNGNATDTIDISYTSSAGWTWVIWKDVDGNGVPGSAGDVILSDTDADGKIDTGSLAAGASVALLAVATIPPGTSNGTIDNAIITGTSSLNASLTSSVTMTTTVKAPVLSISKGLTAVQAPNGGAVCTPTNPSTGAGCTVVPQSVLTYQISCTNNGSGNATAVIITDLVPNYTAYKAGTIKTGSSAATLVSRTDAADGDGGRFDSGANAVIAGGAGNLSIGAGATWVVEFQLIVN